MVDEFEMIRSIERETPAGIEKANQQERQSDRRRANAGVALDRNDPDELPADDGYLDVPEVASYLRISKSMVYKLVETKQIPAIRLGRLVRIRKSDLNDALRRLGNR